MRPFALVGAAAASAHLVDFWLGVGVAAGLFAGMILHEYAHARLAVAVGDMTPKAYHRVTLNPKAHIDPLGTIIIPGIFVVSLMVGQPFGFLFGYAKPVPINTRNMRPPRYAPLFVALAGPGTNFLLALAAGIALRVVSPTLSADPLPLALTGALTVNVFLGIVNSLPIPPLDGSRVLGLFLSPQAAFKMEEMSQYFILFLVVIFLFFRGVLGAMANPVCSALSFNTLNGCVL